MAPFSSPVTFDERSQRTHGHRGRMSTDGGLLDNGGNRNALDLESLPGAALEMRPDGRIASSNAAFTALTGFTTDDVRDRQLDVLFGAETELSAIVQVRDALARGEVYTGELLSYRKSQQAFWNDLIVWPSHDAQQRVVRLVALIRDVTPRRRMLDASTLPGAGHSLVLDRLQAGIVIHDASTEILYANAKATELLGITHKRILGAVDTDPRWVFIAEDGSSLRVEDYPVSRAMRTRSVVTNYVIGVRRESDGHELWAMCNAYPVLDDTGALIEVVVSFTDVTGLKEAERALAKSEERLRLVLQGSTDAPWDWDLRTSEIYYAPSWFQMIGYSEHEETIDSKFWLSLLHPDDRNVLADLERDLASGATACEAEFRLRHKAGHYVRVLSRFVVLRGSDGAPIRISGTNTDVTERRAMEARLQRTQRMEAIGHLAGGVAHDFNNLLAVICGNIELLQLELAANGTPSDLLGEALNAAYKGAGLTRRLLTSTRQQALQPTVVDVERVIDSTVLVLRRLISESIRIDTMVAPVLARILIDAGELENALINLAINARDAMPRGGVLAISAENLDFGDDAIPNELDLTPGPYVRISVSDNGSGMTKEVAQRALEPFFTTKPVGSGSGLGLSMVDGFVRQSGGQARVLSEVGIGTSVQLYLPATLAALSGMPTPAKELPRASELTPEVVLVVEDDPSVRRYCLRCLSSLGYRTIEAANGPDALAALNAAGRVDLLLTDVVMPNGMNGPEVVAAAKRHQPDLRVLYMSGYLAHMLDAEEHLATPRVLTKPFSRASLATRIRALLDTPSHNDAPLTSLG